MTTVVFDKEGFGTSERRIRWTDLVAVGIRTTSDGPWGEDVFWQFQLPDRVLELPGSCVTGEAVGFLQRAIPGIDSFKIMEAMCTTSPRVFRLWRAGEPSAGHDRERLHARFDALLGRLGAGSAPPATFDMLMAAWSDTRRRYHGIEHLTDCLWELDGAIGGVPIESGLADRVELALWYHDAIYVPTAPDNESQSAAWLRSDGGRFGLPAAVLDDAARLVLATVHTEPPPGEDPGVHLVRDIDRAILGRDVLRFMEYEYGVAEEYASMPGWLFGLRRGRFLADLLAQPGIYHTPFFRDRYEARARASLSALLQSPTYRLFRWRRALRLDGWSSRPLIKTTAC